MNKSHSFHSSLLRFRYFIKTWPVYLLLLPVFFVLHGFNRNYNSVTAAEALVLTLLYLAATLIIAGISWLIYRDLAKSCLIAFFIMAWHFFFGNMQDALKDLSPQTFVSQYRFMLPAGFFLFLALAIWLKRRKRSLQSFISYLNIVLLVCLLIDTSRLVVNLSDPPKNKTLNPATVTYTICDTCKKPDIYLLLFDQYAGNTALKEVFNFDNTAFKNELERRGFFFTKNSISNYNLTPFSMASILNMDYLTPEMGVKKNLNVGYCYRMISKSRVLQLLSENGYSFHNYSVFDFPGQQAKKYGAFFPYGQDLISMQTFTSRLTRDIRSDILHGKFGFKGIQKKIAYEYLYFNDKIFELTREIADRQASSPRFIYSHFIMPHYPYYFDSKGATRSPRKTDGAQNNHLAGLY